MHSRIGLSTILLLTSTVHAANIADLIAVNHALTSLAEPIDVSVVAITAQTDPTIAQQIPFSLQNLTNAITADLNPPTADPNAPTTGHDTIVNSFGLFANTAEELMYDYYIQRSNLIGVFGLQSAIYSQLGPFNTAFQNYATLVSGVAGNAADQIIIGYNTGNTTEGIKNATITYAP